MSENPKTIRNRQGGAPSLPIFDKEQRYAQALNPAVSWFAPSFGAFTPAAHSVPNVQGVSGMDITNYVLHSISPIQAPPTLTEDVQAFTRSVKDVIAAVNDKVISPEEGDAVIGFLAEQFAARRATAALSRIGFSVQTTL